MCWDNLQHEKAKFLSYTLIHFSGDCTTNSKAYTNIWTIASQHQAHTNDYDRAYESILLINFSVYVFPAETQFFAFSGYSIHIMNIFFARYVLNVAHHKAKLGNDDSNECSW